jgi:hypothetical protein
MDPTEPDHLLQTAEHLLPDVLDTLQESSEHWDQVLKVLGCLNLERANDPHEGLEGQLMVRLQRLVKQHHQQRLYDNRRVVLQVANLDHGSLREQLL